MSRMPAITTGRSKASSAASWSAWEEWTSSQQLVRLREPAGGVGAGLPRLTMSFLPLVDAGEQAGDPRGDRRHWVCPLHPGCHPSISTIRRTGRLLAPSMPVSSSTFPALPPQPS